MNAAYRRHGNIFGLSAVAALFLAFCLGGCAVGGDFQTEEGCPSPDFAARYELVGSPRICGGCDPDCHLTTDRPELDDFSDLNGDGIPDYPDPEGRLWGESTAYVPADDGVKIVPPGVRVTSQYAWSAGPTTSTLTKVHLQNFTVDGVYRVGLESLGVGGNSPSRTTVDVLGCAYVAGRAFSAQGSVTKVAGELEDCPDRNGNGIVDTNDGSFAVADVYDWPNTVGMDECVLWAVPVGAIGGTPRAMAIDALGRIWIGLYSSMQFVVISSIDGSHVATVNVDDRPYGAAVTPDGMLYYSTLGAANVQAINTLTPMPTDADVQAVVAFPPTSHYGMAINQYEHVFVSQWGGMQRYDPVTNSWDQVAAPAGGGGSGVGTHEDGYALSAGGSVVNIFDTGIHGLSLEDPLPSPLPAMTFVDSFPVPQSYGVCMDFYGNAWTADRTNNAGQGTMSVVDIGDPGVAGDGGVLATIPVFSQSYTYSDFTGYGLMTFAALVGYIFRDYESVDACGDDGLIRERLYYSATFDDPGIINFHGRSASNSVDLGDAPETWLGTADGSSAPGAMFGSVPIRGPMSEGEASEPYFRLRIEILRAGLESPVMHEWTLEEYCL